MTFFAGFFFSDDFFLLSFGPDASEVRLFFLVTGLGAAGVCGSILFDEALEARGGRFEEEGELVDLFLELMDFCLSAGLADEGGEGSDNSTEDFELDVALRGGGTVFLGMDFVRGFEGFFGRALDFAMVLEREREDGGEGG